MTDSERIFGVLTNEERIALSLRVLYNEHGYRYYKMEKFEEYDLYSKNKDFLASQSVITFNDTDGRLLALKPDVTLSIIKNTSHLAATPLKLCYNENVYRISSKCGSFREIMQAGLEYIGDVDTGTLGEVIMLAKKSLDVISENNVLEISSLDIVCELLEHFNYYGSEKSELISAIKKKNTSRIIKLCKSSDTAKVICSLTEACSDMKQIGRKLDSLRLNDRLSAEVDRFASLLEILSAREVGVSVDFSVLNDMNYYSGVSFSGFVNGVPCSVLSGGEYRRLMEKMERQEGAVGFAVYLDELEHIASRLGRNGR